MSEQGNRGAGRERRTGRAGPAGHGGQEVPARLKPSLLFVVLRPLGWLIGVAVFVTLCVVIVLLPREPIVPPLHLVGLGVGLVAVRLAWETLEWGSRAYVIDGDRVRASFGVLRRTHVELRLEDVQTIVNDRPIVQRLFGLGTITLGTASEATPGLRLLMLSDSEGVAKQIREAVEAARRERANQTGVRGAKPGAGARLPEAGGTQAGGADSGRPVAGGTFVVVGLTGGIGAGKSAVARALAARGFVVSDSDAEAKAMLDDPEVWEQLVAWWGRDVLGADGRVDRKAVANVVFKDEAQRKRLEAVVHPRLRAGREAVRAQAASRGAAGMVIDAPLLLEAGLEGECDAIVFVDAPREQRLARVRASRGWDEQELSRREAAQLPIEEKKRRSTHVIVNDGAPEAIEAKVAALVEELKKVGDQRARTGARPTL
ncbi:MAG: dephospho-CoA kinase [Planctomycetota bacterium]|nr:dephospho-CoA kinase [Planctomycetota bacterium]